MSKKDPAEAAPESATIPADETPAITELLQDEFAGQGGSYSIDPVTQKRIKNLGE